jgi:hypothetical protein
MKLNSNIPSFKGYFKESYFTKKEEEILKQEVRNKNAAYRMAIFA